MDEEEDYCDKREYWHVSLRGRTLLAVDCAEQSGADNQGSVTVYFDGKNLELTYTEWLSSDGCKRSVALVDWQTTKILRMKEWTGRSSPRRDVCSRTRPVKASARLGDGTLQKPLLLFHD